MIQFLFFVLLKQNGMQFYIFRNERARSLISWKLFFNFQLKMQSLDLIKKN